MSRRAKEVAAVLIATLNFTSSGNAYSNLVVVVLNSLSLSLMLISAPFFLFSSCSTAQALNEAEGQQQCVANWPSLPVALAACD